MPIRNETKTVEKLYVEDKKTMASSLVHNTSKARETKPETAYINRIKEMR